MTTCFGSSHFVRASQFFLHRSFPSKCFPGQPQRGGRTFFTNEKAKYDAKESAEWKLWTVCSERSLLCLTEAVTQCFLRKTWQRFSPSRGDRQCGFSLPLAFPSPGSKVIVAATEMFACLEASCLLRFSMWLHVDALLTLRICVASGSGKHTAVWCCTACWGLWQKGKLHCEVFQYPGLYLSPVCVLS